MSVSLKAQTILLSILPFSSNFKITYYTVLIEPGGCGVNLSAL